MTNEHTIPKAQNLLTEGHIPLVYLDWNVMVRMHQGDLPRLFEAVRVRGGTAAAVPFSLAILREAAGIEGEGRKKRLSRRLDFIHSITGNLYLGEDDLTPIFDCASPHSVYEEKGHGFDVDVGGELSSMLPYGVLDRSRKQLGLSPRELNNASPDEAATVIDELLRTDAVQKWMPTDASLGLKGMLDFGRKLYQAHKGGLAGRFGLAASDLSGMDRGALEFSFFYGLLDSCGFWNDKRQEYAKGSRIEDVAHARLSASCGRLVSEDKRFRKKAQACFSYFAERVNVFSAQEAVDAFV